MSNSWLEVTNPRYEKQDLAGMIMRSDLLISDLDDTIAKSPMKSIARGFFKRPKMLSNAKFLKWCMKAGWNILKKGKKAESALGKEFVESFLSNPDEKERLKRIITREYAVNSFYPGAQLFYRQLPEKIKKLIVTRSIEEIAEPYKDAAGFDIAYSFQYNKEDTMREIIIDFPQRRRYILIGDSEEDEQALDYLKFLHKYVKLDTLVSVYIAKSKNRINEKFDINIGRNYKGLAAIIASYSLTQPSSAR